MRTHTRLTGPQQSNFAAYIGNNIVDVHDDVIVVTFNYRMNIFGQPNAPQFNTPGQAQNFGLLDIAAAIEWVHANIAEFGGDPGRITLFGQSAGSVAIDAYVYAQAAAGNAPLIQGIIMESGTYVCPTLRFSLFKRWCQVGSCPLSAYWKNRNKRSGCQRMAASLESGWLWDR